MNGAIQAERRLPGAPRIVLREHRFDDLEAFCELQMDPDVARYVAWLPRTRAQCEAALTSVPSRIDQQGRIWTSRLSTRIARTR